MPSTTKTLFTALASAAAVIAHGHVDNIVVNGVYYAGYDVTSLPYQADPPVVIGWASDATDNGFIAPDAFGDADIICHKNAKNAQGYAKVAAGDNIFLQWNTWPESHKGPVLDYLAACGDDGCGSVDKESLKFFKIDEGGLIDGSTGTPGTYADDVLIENGNGWTVQIPKNVKPGYYVLRHEIIALHSANQENGAQAYPQCLNLEITGSGTEEPEGTLGTELYKADDAGILFNLYTSVSSYPIPGPTLISGVSATVAQSKVTATSTADVLTFGAGSGSGSGSGSASTTAAGASATSAAAGGQTGSAQSQPAATSAAAVTSAAEEPVATEPAATEPAATPTSTTTPRPTGGCLSKRGKKARRHARDVKARRASRRL